MVVGYPSKRYLSTLNIDEVEVKRTINKGSLYPKTDQSHIFHYTMQTGIGFSGGPIFVRDKYKDQFKIVGIHTHRGQSNDYNSGLKFNANLLRKL